MEVEHCLFYFLWHFYFDFDIIQLMYIVIFLISLIFPFFINHYSISVFSCMLVNSWPTFKILPFIFEKNYNFTILHHYKNNEYSLQKHWSLQKSVKNKLKIICNLLVTFWSISFLYFFPWIYISYYFCLVEVKIYIPFKKYPTLFI